MRIPSSSSLLLATLAISTSSPALAAPVPEGNADGGFTSSSSGQQLASSGSQSNIAHGRRGSVSAEQKPLGSYKRMSYIHNRQLENRQLGIGALGGITHSVGDTLSKLLHARDDEDHPASDAPPASSLVESSSSVLSSAIPTSTHEASSTSASATESQSTLSESASTESQVSSASVSATEAQPSATEAPLQARQLGLGALLDPLMPVVNSLPEPVPQLVGTVVKILARDEEATNVRRTETTAPIIGRRFAQPRDEASSAALGSTSEPPISTPSASAASVTCGETVGAASFGEYAVPMAQNVLPAGMQQYAGVVQNLIPGGLVPGNLIPGNLVPGNLIPGNLVPGNLIPGNIPLGGLPLAGGILSPVIPNAPYNTPVGTPMNNPGQFIPGTMPGGYPPSTPPLFGFDAEDQPQPVASGTASSTAAGAIPTVA